MRSKLALISDEYGRAGCLGPVHVVVAPASLRYLKRVWVIAPAGSETELMWALRSKFPGK